MLRVLATRATSRGGAHHDTGLGDASRAALRDIIEPLPGTERPLFTAVPGSIVYSGPAYASMSHLGSFWRDMIAMPERIHLLPTTLFSLMNRGVRSPVGRDVDAGRAFVVDALNSGLSVPRLEVRPPGYSGGAVFGQTGAAGPYAFVAYCTQSEGLPSSRAPGNDARNYAVFRQAKVSETLVHEISVHAIALLAHRWDDGRRFENHYDGFGEHFMTHPEEWPLYQSPLGRGIGLAALLRDCDPNHLARGLDLQREAYEGVRRRYAGVGRNDGVWSASYERHGRQVEFLRARQRELD